MKNLSNVFLLATTLILKHIHEKGIFDEKACWIQHENEEGVHFEASIEDETSTTTTQQQQPLPNSPNSSSSTSFDETPPRNFRSLREIYATTQAMFVADPTTFEEAVQKEEWSNAMKEELTAIQRNKTWDLVDLPEGKKSIGVKWVFKTKFHANGSVEKHKARLVAKGYS